MMVVFCISSVPSSSHFNSTPTSYANVVNGNITSAGPKIDPWGTLAVTCFLALLFSSFSSALFHQSVLPHLSCMFSVNLNLLLH